MRKFVNSRAEELKPSGIRKFFDIVSEMKDAISLGVGEPDFITPWNIRNAAVKSIQRGYTQYTGNRGLPQLREYISRYMDERFGAEYPPEHILGYAEFHGMTQEAGFGRGDLQAACAFKELHEGFVPVDFQYFAAADRSVRLPDLHKFVIRYALDALHEQQGSDDFFDGLILFPHVLTPPPLPLRQFPP